MCVYILHTHRPYSWNDPKTWDIIGTLPRPLKESLERDGAVRFSALWRGELRMTPQHDTTLSLL